MKNREQKKEILKVQVSGKDRLKELAMYAFFALILYLFYRSFYAWILLIPGIFFYHRYYQKELLAKYREVLNLQFKDALLSISAALRAGYSMENAVAESLEEMQRMYGNHAPIVRELQMIKNQTTLGIPLETAFYDFAERSQVEDIETFVAVFGIAKRTGGDLVEIIQKTSSDIASKIDTRNEIAVVVRSKRLEQNIMALMPPVIILYIELTAGSILAPLYQSLLGRTVMTICLGIYIGAYFLSGKIMKIEV